MWVKAQSGSNNGRVNLDQAVSLLSGPGDGGSGTFAVHAVLVTGTDIRVSPNFATQAEAEAEIDRLIVDGS